MVWNCSESSDSEVERHDRFRSERTNVPKAKLNVKKILSESVGRSNHSRTGGGETRDQRGICARCDYRVESCRCRSRLSPDTSDRHSSTGRRHRSDSEERHSRKRRSSGEDQRVAKRKTKDGRSEDGVKQHSERNGRSRPDTEQKKQRKKCKKKLKEKLREENRKKSKSPKQVDQTHSPERSIVDRVTACEPTTVKKTDVESTDDFNDVYGPALPIRHQDVIEGEETTSPPSQSGDEERKGEAADTSSCLPTQEEDDEDSAAYGPVLPPQVSKPKQRVYGPTLPSGASSDPSPPHSTASETTREIDSDKGQEDDDSQHDNDDHDDGDDVGPLPEGSRLTPSQIQLQHRANLLRLHMENKGDLKEVKREEWMIELPDRQRTSIGTLLAPRSFRTKESATVDPSWTDTPQEKAKKEALSQLGLGDPKRDKEELNRRAGKQRDKQMDLLAEKAKKRSDKSLLEMHQHKLSKEKKDEKAGERRPFNRETDLGISRLTQAQKQSIYKKAAALDSRFSSGQSKYL